MKIQAIKGNLKVNGNFYEKNAGPGNKFLKFIQDSVEKYKTVR